MAVDRYVGSILWVLRLYLFGLWICGGGVPGEGQNMRRPLCCSEVGLNVTARVLRREGHTLE